MKCPYCGSDDIKVIDKRESDEESNRRRRECLKCGKRFTTYERIEMVEITVVKRDGRRESFNRDKILKGILKACEKRPISNETIQATVDEIEAEILGGDDIEIKSTIIGDLIMKHLKKIDEVAYIRFASVYRQFKDLDEFEDELKNLKVVEHKDKKQLQRESNPLVSTAAKDSISIWDRQKIADALVKEINLTPADASEIAFAVEKKVQRSQVKTISVSLVRELVNNELFERNYTKKLEHQEILGLSSYNLSLLLFNPEFKYDRPEYLKNSISNSVLKQFALNEIYSKDVSEAHLKAIIHIHDLGSINPFATMYNIEHIKLSGLKMPVSTMSAKHVRVLTGQLSSYLNSIHGNNTDRIEFSYLNIFYAPFLSGLGKEYIKQEAQSLLFSLARNSMPVVELHIHTNIPKVLLNKPAVCPKGSYQLRKPNNEIVEMNELESKYVDEHGNVIQPDTDTIGHIMTYSDFKHESTEFCKSIIEAWIKGDAVSKPFQNIINLHIDSGSFIDSMQADIIKLACKNPKNIRFVLDRDIETRSETDSISKNEINVLQNIGLNIVQCAYMGKDLDGTLKELDKSLDIAVKAFLQHNTFVQKLGCEGMIMELGLIGVEQAIKLIAGKSLNETAALKDALKIASYVYTKCKEYERSEGIRIRLSITPDASERMAHVDAAQYPLSATYNRYSDSISTVSGLSAEENIELAGRFNPIWDYPIMIYKPAKPFELLEYAYSSTNASKLTFEDK